MSTAPPAPTNTERVLYGPGGSRNPYDAYYLERYLLSREELYKRYDEAAEPIKMKLDQWNDPEYDPWSEGCSIGMGWSPEAGWFILGSGQGAFVIWLECDPYGVGMSGEAVREWFEGEEDAYDFWNRVKDNAKANKRK